MNNYEFTFLIGIGSFIAGLVGSLSGMGGGIIIVPLLVLLAHVNIHYAIGASLMAVIATSASASITYSREGFCNVKLAIIFITATTVGAVIGAHTGSFIPENILQLIFGMVLMLTVLTSLLPHKHVMGILAPDRFVIEGTFPTFEGQRTYHTTHLPFGYAAMFFAGICSGMLGIGSGSVQVPIMDRVMHLPFKVATTTSTLVIGITGLASAGVYLNKGYFDPPIVMPVVLGNLLGAFCGAHLMEKVKTIYLRELFLFLIFIIGAHTIYDGLNK